MSDPTDVPMPLPATAAPVAAPAATPAQPQGHSCPSATVKTTERIITRRGVMWLGQTCNIRCYFCYFLDRINDKEHIEHAFMDLEKAKHICHELRYVYGNTAIDIQGGEPTIFKGIYELVAYCREIGLIPTLITNAVALADETRCQRLKEAGIRDLLVSIQGIGETYDKIVGLPGGSAKQMKALANFKQVGIPIRMNVVLSKPVMEQLPQIAQLAIDNEVRAVNFLAFNPFQDQQDGGKRSAANVPSYTEVGAALDIALDLLAAAGIEANVRYIPLCMVKEEHRKSMYNYQQLPYDLHEWDYGSWTWSDQLKQRSKPGETSRLSNLRYLDRPAPENESDKIGFIDRDPDLYDRWARNSFRKWTGYKYAPQCDQCAAKSICDGVHADYMDIFGSTEPRPIQNATPITDPKFYINHQEKIVEEEDWNWALSKKSGN